MTGKANPGSSRGKRTKKVDTPHLCITSSITDPQVDPPQTEFPVLSPDERSALLEWMHKGAGPGAACAQLGVSIERFWRTLLEDREFSERLQQLFDTLGSNVLAALYQAAMKGNVTAQQFWLRQRPVAAWSTQGDAPHPDHSLQRLNDDELVDACRAAGIDLPDHLAARSPTPPRCA